MADYTTIAEMRSEGVTVAQADDARLAILIDEASRTIDQVTGWVYAPTLETLELEGRGRKTLWPSLPLIELTSVLVDDEPVDLDDLRLLGRAPSRKRPVSQISKKCGTWCRGALILLEGTWGYTEPDGTPEGRTPREIARAARLLVMRSLPLASEEDDVETAHMWWRITEQRTRDQAIKTAPIQPGQLTGDPIVDEILARYMPNAMLTTGVVQ